VKIHGILTGILAFVIVTGLGTPAFAITTETGMEISAGNEEPTVRALQLGCNVLNTFDDRTAFDAAVGSTTLEDFTDTFHFPISTGILNSDTNLVVVFGPPILPGDIQPGVTYSMPIGTGNFFNIDAFGGYVGGFLDGIKNPQFEPVTITFDNPLAAFGFDTNQLMGLSFDITIQFTSGPDFVGNFPVTQNLSLEFFGFQSEQSDIETVIIQSDGTSSFDYAFDNFAFGGQGCLMAVGGDIIPLDSTMVLVAGAQHTAAWMFPIIVAAAGFGLLIQTQKTRLKLNSCPSCKLESDDIFELGDKTVAKCDNPKCKVSLFFIK